MDQATVTLLVETIPLLGIVVVALVAIYRRYTITMKPPTHEKESDDDNDNG